MELCECLVLTAHPDDAFIAAGGTILKMKDIGLKTIVVSVTDGENMGNNNGTRIIEFNKSIQVCGIDGELCHMTDGLLQYKEQELCRHIFNILNKHNPRYIITHSLRDSHTDHRITAKATNKSIELMLHTMKEGCRLKAIFYLMPIRIDLSTINMMNPNVVCDVSKYIERKREIVSIHQSQYPYIHTNLQKHIALNVFLGSLSSCDYAEGFTVTHLKKNISFENELNNSK